MMSTLNAIAQSITQPAQRHAMLAHLPIALVFVVAGLMVFFLLSRGKSGTLRCILLALLLTGGLLSFMTAQAGQAAMEQLNLPLTPDAAQLLESHEFKGNLLWIPYLATAAMVGLTALRIRLVRYPAVILATLAALVLVGWVVVVAHEGGSLVYSQGVGVPSSPNNVSPAKP